MGFPASETPEIGRKSFRKWLFWGGLWSSIGSLVVTFLLLRDRGAFFGIGMAVFALWGLFGLGLLVHGLIKAWQYRRTTVVLRFALAIPILALVAWGTTLVSEKLLGDFGVGRHLNERELRQHFRDCRQTYAQLLRDLQHDREAGHLEEGIVTLQTLHDLSQSARIDHYRETLDELGAENFRFEPQADTLEVTVSVQGFLVAGSSRSIAYAPKRVETKKASFESLPPNHEVWMRLEDGWFMKGESW